MPQYQLDTLPVEIIRLIAASGPYTSVAALATVNHRLRSACESWTIYRDLIQVYGDLSDQWLPHSLSTCTDKTAWMKYARAHTEAVEITTGGAFVPHIAIRSLIHWLPQLVIVQRERLHAIWPDPTRIILTVQQIQPCSTTCSTMVYLSLQRTEVGEATSTTKQPSPFAAPL